MSAVPTTAPVTQPKVNARVAVVCVCVRGKVRRPRWYISHMQRHN